MARLIHSQPKRRAKRVVHHIQWAHMGLMPLSKQLSQLGFALIEYMLTDAKRPAPTLWDPFAMTPALEKCFPGSKKFVPSAEQPKRPRAKLKKINFRLFPESASFYFQRLHAQRNAGKPAKTYWRPLQNALARGTYSPLGFGRLATLFLAHRLFGTQTFRLPAYLWKTVGRLAFESAVFREKVFRLVYAYLRRRVVLTHDLPEFSLNAHTFWLLIALHRSPKANILLRWLPKHRRHRSLQQALAKTATLQAHQAGWAGFWDQWVLYHWLNRFPTSLDNLESDLKESVLALPLLAPIRARYRMNHPAPQVPTQLVLADESRRFKSSWCLQLCEPTLKEVPPYV